MQIIGYAFYGNPSALSNGRSEKSLIILKLCASTIALRRFLNAWLKGTKEHDKSFLTNPPFLRLLLLLPPPVLLPPTHVGDRPPQYIPVVDQ